MATAAQTAANRRNAQRSTGPRTAEGKSASRLNSLRHGLAAVRIFPTQNQPEFDALAADYAARFEPESVEQSQRVDSMLHADWNLRRYRQLHEDTWEALRQESPGMTDAQLLLADLRGARIIDKLLRYQKDLQRAYDRALAEFVRVAKVEAEATEVLLRNQQRQVRQDVKDIAAPLGAHRAAAAAPARPAGSRGDETNPISSSGPASAAPRDPGRHQSARPEATADC